MHEPPQGLNLDEDTLEDYLGNNVARMIGIEPTARPKTLRGGAARAWPAPSEQRAARRNPDDRRRLTPERADDDPIMIIDTHLHPTNLVDEAWRHTGTPFNGERMLKMMDGPYMINGKPRRIDMGFIQPPPGNTGYRDGNRMGRDGIRDYMAYITELTQKYPDRFIGNFTYNPRWGPENGAARAGVPRQGVRLQDAEAARQHARLPARPRARLAAPGDEDVRQVQHRGADPHRRRAVHDPDHVLPDHPRVPDGQLHHRPLRHPDRRQLLVRGLLDGDGHAQRVLRDRGWCFQSRIVEFAKELPRHKIVFGTDSPPNEPGMWLRELEVLCSPAPQGMNLDEDGLEDYMGNNIARLVGIEPTQAAEGPGRSRAAPEGHLRRVPAAA